MEMYKLLKLKQSLTEAKFKKLVKSNDNPTIRKNNK
jgi:hypothetical protein